MKLSAFAAAAAFACLVQPAQAFTLFSANGTIAEITPTVDAFRDALGDLNAPEPVNVDGGRRQINWDAAPDGISDPNFFPGDFFNFPAAPRARGIEFSTPGDGFMLSSTAASSEPVNFGQGGSGISPFSVERVFSPIGSPIVDVNFFNPAEPDSPAVTTGLGVVFVDVEGTTSSMEFFDINGDSLLKETVPFGDDGSFSFLGAAFDSAVVASVRIVSGDLQLLADGSLNSQSGDFVVMDDFIFGEPTQVPLPAAGWLLLAGIGGLAAVRRRRAAA
ncbi:MAG: VPLPA-CTERM sorting domain-containing protein [Pseudomonadota bacterium]